MRITKITTNNFTSSSKPQETSDKNSTDVLKMFHDKAKNSADMTDSILVPRTIFKGYLGIMTGTTLLTLSSFTSKFSKISKYLRKRNLSSRSNKNNAFNSLKCVLGKYVSGVIAFP